MVMQTLQVFTISLALLLVVFSYVQMQEVLNPCMVRAPSMRSSHKHNDGILGQSDRCCLCASP